MSCLWVSAVALRKPVIRWVQLLRDKIAFRWFARIKQTAIRGHINPRHFFTSCLFTITTASRQVAGWVPLIGPYPIWGSHHPIRNQQPDKIFTVAVQLPFSEAIADYNRWGNMGGNYDTLLLRAVRQGSIDQVKHLCQNYDASTTICCHVSSTWWVSAISS